MATYVKTSRSKDGTERTQRVTVVAGHGAVLGRRFGFPRSSGPYLRPALFPRLSARREGRRLEREGFRRVH